jgi:GTP cyclohydrolase II
MKRQVEARIPTKQGVFRMLAYARRSDALMPHIAFVSEHFQPGSEPVTIRVHSECITGDLFGSTRCDCGAQLERAIQEISEKHGVLIYLRQEGRGIGLINKLKAYNLQDAGLNTLDANVHLGFAPDARNYEVAIQILRDLGIESVRLLTNNPEKAKALEHAGITVIERLPLIIPAQAENLDYQTTKQQLMGHLLGL